MLITMASSSCTFIQKVKVKEYSSCFLPESCSRYFFLLSRNQGIWFLLKVSVLVLLNPCVTYHTLWCHMCIEIFLITHFRENWSVISQLRKWVIGDQWIEGRVDRDGGEIGDTAEGIEGDHHQSSHKPRLVHMYVHIVHRRGCVFSTEYIYCTP